jgi:hypothetical protein
MVVEISAKPSGVTVVWKLLGPEHAFVYVLLAIGAEEQNMANIVDEAANRTLRGKTEEDGVDQLLSRSCQMMEVGAKGKEAPCS